ncbi:MAG: tetraacyldisaccharide 4'-kinase [bacterium]
MHIFHSIIHQLQRGWQQPGWINWLALPLSYLYGALMWLRRLCYQSGLATQQHLAVPVIVVGNLTVGGTGKTPLVIELVEYLREKGWTPGVITRGYGGNSSYWPRTLKISDKAEEVGDEPLLIQKRTGGPVVAGPDRVSSARLLVDRLNCDIVISDDGFQHLGLARDLDIVMIDGQRRLGNGWCLPAGPMREFKSVLAEADIKVVNSAVGPLPGEHAMMIHYGDLYRLNAPETSMALSDLRGRRVHAVAGLGNPRRFFDLLQREGLELELHQFSDHHVYTPNDLAFLGGDEILIMTEKDAIKCGAIGISGEIWVLPIRVNLNSAFYDDLERKLASASVSSHGGDQ